MYYLCFLINTVFTREGDKYQIFFYLQSLFSRSLIEPDEKRMMDQIDRQIERRIPVYTNKNWQTNIVIKITLCYQENNITVRPGHCSTSFILYNLLQSSKMSFHFTLISYNICFSIISPLIPFNPLSSPLNLLQSFLSPYFVLF